MNVKITFRSEVVISGETIDDVRNKWESLGIYSKEALKNGVDFVEISSVEDADSDEEVSLY